MRDAATDRDAFITRAQHADIGAADVQADIRRVAMDLEKIAVGKIQGWGINRRRVIPNIPRLIQHQDGAQVCGRGRPIE
ncbi:hypothetical protein D3C72_1234700 [compost metagenome]